MPPQKRGFSVDAAHAIVCNHAYNIAKKLSCLKADIVDILMITLHSPGREHEDRTKDPGISILHSAQCALTSVCLILFH